MCLEFFSLFREQSLWWSLHVLGGERGALISMAPRAARVSVSPYFKMVVGVLYLKLIDEHGDADTEDAEAGWIVVITTLQ